MNVQKTSWISLMSIALMTTMLLPAFGEVQSLNTDTSNYSKNQEILFSGSVEDTDRGLVTIVIHDPQGKFVLLEQTMIQADSTFEKKLAINSQFELEGEYRATGFMVNMTAGDVTNFVYSKTSSTTSSSITEKTDEEQKTTFTPPPEHPKTNTMSEKSLIADFVDPQKDPQEYLDRYYSEPEYQAWFDRNYPDVTIEEAVGYDIDKVNVNTITERVEEIINPQIIPEAEALVEVPSSNADTFNAAEITPMALAVSGLGVLFAAVYGIKRKVDNNSLQILKNRETIKTKLLSGIFQNNPQDVLKQRLVKGEISIKEFESLRETLNKK